MGRQLLHNTRAVCAAMAMAASTRAAAAFSTSGSNYIQHRQVSRPFYHPDLTSQTLQSHSTLPSRDYRRYFAATKNSNEDCSCDATQQFDGSEEILQTKDGSIGNLLRETILTNADGNSVKLGNFIGNAENDATIVVFLRHLA